LTHDRYKSFSLLFDSFLFMPLKTLYIIPQYARSGVVWHETARNKRENEKCVSPRKISSMSDFWRLRSRDAISFDTTAARLRSKVCRVARWASGPILRGVVGEGEKARAAPKSRPWDRAVRESQLLSISDSLHVPENGAPQIWHLPSSHQSPLMRPWPLVQYSISTSFFSFAPCAA